MPTSTIQTICLLITILVGVFAVIKAMTVLVSWYNKRMKAEGSTDTLEFVKDSFIHDIATNHLPHLFNSDRKIAEGVNLLLEASGSSHRVEIEEAPPIRWLPYDPSKK